MMIAPALPGQKQMLLIMNFSLILFFLSLHALVQILHALIFFQTCFSAYTEGLTIFTTTMEIFSAKKKTARTFCASLQQTCTLAIQSEI